MAMIPRNLLLAVFLVLAVSSSATLSVAQETQVTSNVNLAYMSVRLSYPAEVSPGQDIQVNADVSTLRSVRLLNLTIRIYYPMGSDLQSLGTWSIAGNIYADRSTRLSRVISVTVPASAPRTTLIALVSESVQITYYLYTLDSTFYYRPPYPNYSFYPSLLRFWPPYTYVDATDNAVAPLSYVKATTPELASLQSEMQMLQQQLEQARMENQKLHATLQSQQSAANENTSTIANLNQSLAAAENLVRLLEVVTLILVIAVVILVAVLFGMGRVAGRQKPRREESSRKNQSGTQAALNFDR